MKKLRVVLTTILVLTVFVGGSILAGAKGSLNEREEVHFWYLWSGVEGELVQQIISDYNASQDKYEVIGLSVPDQQKIITAIASGNGPDITDNFSNNVASWASKGVYLQLDDLIVRDNVDINDFVSSALDTCKYNDKIYAFPINLTVMGLYYNKELLEEAGYEYPPKTDKELFEIAVKTTKTDEDGNITTLGFPDFPNIYYTNNMSFAFGGDYINEDGTELTPDNEGTIKALNLICDYRSKFGYENTQRFNASAGGYVSPTDPFILGEQALRIDGPWLIRFIKDFNPDLKFGVAPLPYPAGHPELAGGGEITTSTIYIPSNARNKEGAWDFMKYMCCIRDNKVFTDIPPIKSFLKSRRSDIEDNMKVFFDIIEMNNVKKFPSFTNQQEFSTILSSEAELTMDGKKTPEEAMKTVKEKTKNLFK